MNALLTAIFNRFSGSDFETDIGGRMYTRYAPQGVAFPYAVVTLPFGMSDWMFVEQFDDIDVQFNLFSQSTSEVQIGTMLTNLRARYDDTTLTVTGYTFLYCQFERSIALSDPENPLNIAVRSAFNS